MLSGNPKEMLQPSAQVHPRQSEPTWVDWNLAESFRWLENRQRHIHFTHNTQGNGIRSTTVVVGFSPANCFPVLGQLNIGKAFLVEDNVILCALLLGRQVLDDMRPVAEEDVERPCLVG